MLLGTTMQMIHCFGALQGLAQQGVERSDQNVSKNIELTKASTSQLSSRLLATATVFLPIVSQGATSGISNTTSSGSNKVAEHMNSYGPSPPRTTNSPLAHAI